MVGIIGRMAPVKRLVPYIKFPFGKRERPIFKLPVERRKYDQRPIEIPGLDFTDLRGSTGLLAF
ncbi:MAG: hypothetical protein QF918_14250 [Pirellulaceae bacterium]|nr:hypothetical protein [Pirellulaceae bacterium]MDP6553349.1 hypothetical protein [Pirellulaceae bacterium]